MRLPQIPVTIEYRQVTRYLGQRGNEQEFNSDLKPLIHKMINLGKSLMHPTATYANIQLGGEQLDLAGLKKTLKCYTGVSLVAVTVGETIEKEVEQLFQQGQSTQAVILDAVGTVAVEEAANWVLKLLSRQQRVKGLFPGPRIGPGYQGFNMKELPSFLFLAGAEQINIQCNKFYQMTPVKSLVFMVGWSSHKNKLKDKCTLCNKVDCQYRIVRTEGEN